MYQTTPTQPHSLQSPCTKSRQGFALILSLGLMAFVLLLLMSITTLVRVETVSATQAKDMLEARANAQLGLMLAIGELQEHAGSDRRVTAQSGIISDTVEQAHILGVWNSWGEGLEDGDDVTEADVANTYVAGREPRFLTWLIPGADALNFQYPNSVATNNSVELVGLGSLGPTPDPKSRVRMPLVEITKQNTTAGHYSWWISGENSKARVNLYKEEPETGDFAAKSAQLVAAPTLSVKALSGLETIVTDDSARRITTQNSLGFLGQSGAPLTDAIKARFHDITVDSVGLLTNTKSAGMRKDLNLLMELETLPPDYAGEEIFAGGPGWDDLRRYYRNYKLPTEGGLIKWVNGIPHFFAGDTWLEYVGHKRWQRHLPIPIKWQWLLSHYSVPANEATHGTGMYEVRMVFDNIMEMWNPYTIPMEVPSDSHIDFKLWNIPYGVSYYKDGIRWNRSIPKKALFWVVQDMPRVGAWQMHNALIRFDEPLMPGEVQVYSDHSGSPQEISYAIELNSGWEFGGGLYADTLGHGGVKLIVSGSTEIEATLEEDGSAPAWAGFDHFTDIYFVGPSGYPSQYGILKNILTRDSLATVTDDLPQLNEPTFTASQIQGVANKKPFAIVGMRARTEQRIEPSSESPISKSEQARTKHFLFNDPWQNTTSVMNNNETTLRHGGYEFFVQRVNSLNDYPFVEISADDKGYLGTSRGAREPFNGQNHVPIREIPFQPLLSLAQLQHAGLGEPAPDPSFEVPLNNPDAGVPYISYPYVANAFGNSWALPFIKGTMIEQSAIAPDSGTMRLLHDKAWKSNSALWDDWCFSSVSPQNNELVPPADQRTISEVLTEALTGEKSLPNSRYRIVNVLQDAEAITTAADLLASSGEGYRKLTSLLVCDGAFNVNSTSVEAWKGFLASLDGRSIAWLASGSDPILLPGVNDLTFNSAVQAYPVSHFTMPNAGSAKTDEFNSNQREFLRKRWEGVRSLTITEVDELAQAIVVEVRERGPFLSLAEFVNRRLQDTVIGDDGNGLKGALQEAIDQTSINASFDSTSEIITDVHVDPAAYLNKEAAKGITGEGAPGYVTQADILMPLAPLVRVRSDTFRVRAYGDKLHPTTGKVIARAYCEAVLQRISDYVDPTDLPDKKVWSETNPDDNQLTEMNQRFGRQFTIKSFRWLGENEI